MVEVDFLVGLWRIRDCGVKTAANSKPPKFNDFLILVLNVVSVPSDDEDGMPSGDYDCCVYIQHIQFK